MISENFRSPACGRSTSSIGCATAIRSCARCDAGASRRRDPYRDADCRLSNDRQTRSAAIWESIRSSRRSFQTKGHAVKQLQDQGRNVDSASTTRQRLLKLRWKSRWARGPMSRRRGGACRALSASSSGLPACRCVRRFAWAYPLLRLESRSHASALPRVRARYDRGPDLGVPPGDIRRDALARRRGAEAPCSARYRRRCSA
jgi:hypothetical protein